MTTLKIIGKKFQEYVENNIHIILDEVYCGTGTTGKMFAHDWENIKPDFVFLNKTQRQVMGH